MFGPRWAIKFRPCADTELSVSDKDLAIDTVKELQLPAQHYSPFSVWQITPSIVSTLVWKITEKFRSEAGCTMLCPFTRCI